MQVNLSIHSHVVSKHHVVTESSKQLVSFIIQLSDFLVIQFSLIRMLCVHVSQAGLFFAGLWGICVFHELRGREQIGYWLSSVILIAGATMLATSK